MLEEAEKEYYQSERVRLSAMTGDGYAIIVEQFRLLYHVYERMCSHVPGAMARKGWPLLPADFPDETLATALTMFFLGGTSELTSLDATLLANGNDPDIDVLLNTLEPATIAIAAQLDDQGEERMPELRTLLHSGESQLRTETLLRLLYYTYQSMNEGHPPDDDETGLAYIRACTRIMDTLTQLLFMRLSE